VPWRCAVAEGRLALKRAVVAGLYRYGGMLTWTAIGLPVDGYRMRVGWWYQPPKATPIFCGSDEPPRPPEF